jgi:ectoine hydroxylase-related dioxygenase (phytanoyl-CoA dioxygenase family)
MALAFITLSEEELSTKQIGSHNLQKAIEALYRDGTVAITNAVDIAHLDKLNARMLPEAKALFAKQSTHHNFGKETGNIQQELILDKDYIFEDTIANTFATQITECVLGPNPHLRFASANTLFKAEGRQPVHVDVTFDYPNIPFGLCVNIFLVDTSPENGSTELWLGTHGGLDWSRQDVQLSGTGIHPDLVEERRKIAPPIQPSLPKGSLIIRDFRLWHAGMPNKTDDPRIMLGTIHFPKWYRSHQKIELPKTLEGEFEWGNLVPCVNWVDENYDYLQGRHDHNFDLLP